MPELIGELPKPRVLVLNAPEEVAAAIESLAPTVRFVTGQELLEIRQLDWDAAVVFGNTPSLERHLYVIQFGGVWGGEIPVLASPIARSAWMQLNIIPRSRSIQFQVPDELPSTVKPLMPSLVELVTARSVNLVMWAGLKGYSNEGRPIIERPFIMDADGYVLAGYFSRPGTDVYWWWLPADVGHPERWLAAALEYWGVSAPEKFPGKPNWQKRDEWSTPAELRLRTRVKELQDSIDEFMRTMDQEKLNLAMQEDEEFARANNSDRRLLMTQGDGLVDEVQACLEEFGFNVTNVDKEIAAEGDRREDLRISDPEKPGWIALAEVRGYRRGAQLNDLLRIGRFVARYAQENGELPSASWYIVNHNIDQDPSARPTPLASNPGEVRTYHESGGLVIDTRFLFRKRMEVRAGVATPAAVRALFSSDVAILEA